jgi:hypothetical protein
MKMKFHFSSFLLGCAVGAGAVLIAPRIRPVLLELATAAYKLMDTVSAQLAMKREDLEDVLAEAKARARGALAKEPIPAPVPPQASA